MNFSKERNILRKNLDIAFQYFQKWKLLDFQNECINIVFLKSILWPEETKEFIKTLSSHDDIRIQFLKGKFNKSLKSEFNLLSQQEITLCIKELINCSEWSKACNLLVQYGLYYWKIHTSNEIYSWLTQILNYILTQPWPRLDMTKRKRWNQNSENWIYFITHFLLIVFKYNYKCQTKIPSSLLQKCMPLFQRLWNVWKVSLWHPKNNLEIILEIYWITLLAHKEDSILFPLYYNQQMMGEETLCQLKMITLPKKPLKNGKNDFRFYHAFYHTSILWLFVLVNV